MDGTGRATPAGDHEPTLGWRGVGRPSLLGQQYEARLALWLREQPDLTSAEILRRLRVRGYRGGKSALYELVRRMRVQRAVTDGSVSTRELKQ